MSTNKNASFRYRIIDDCLNNKFRKFSAAAILEKIKEKTNHDLSLDMLHKDFAVLRNEFHAPLQYDRVNHCYKYSKKFSLNGISITEEETKIIDNSIAALSLFKGTPFLKEYENIIDKLEVGRNYDATRHHFIQIELPNIDSGIRWFDPLYHSISEKKSIILTYQGFGKEAKDHTISPYLLKEYRNRWYLVGYSLQSKNIKTFALDRLQKIDESIAPYVNSINFNATEYFKYSLGITRVNEQAPIELVLEFSESNLPYILSQPMHHSQKIIIQTPTSVTISIKVYESHELDMSILGYGAGVKVLEPENYKNKLKSIIALMKKLY
ncbi:MAG: WYL domain-containing protein [Bacteroidetes bacterium]|nr:WYL domain-containing protein [Bacteroidota bacterium]